MIEGGSAGGSAQSLAGERRAHAERLLSEAARLEVTSLDERWMANHLAQLPATYGLLHDLTLPDGRGKLDHVVVGPGGAFQVSTVRVDGTLSVQHDQLFVGSHSLKASFDVARAGSQALGTWLGTPVVPVVALVGSVVPVSVPGAIDGVLVTSAERTVHVLAHGAHTQLSAAAVSEVVDRAMPLVAVPGARARSAPVAVPAPVVMPPAMSMAPSASGVPAQKAQKAPKAAKASRTPHQEHSRRFRLAVGAMVLLTVFATGTLVRTLFHEDTSSAAPAPATAAPTSTAPVATVAPVTTVAAPPKIANMPAPTVAFMPVCPAAGAGWSMVPAWPGNPKYLVRYQVEQLGVDGKWSVVSAFATTDAATAAAIPALGPNTTVTVRIVAVMANGSHSPATATPIITPATSC
jgi:hypothetical protein